MALVGKGDGEEEGYCRRFSARTEVKSRRRNGGRSFRPTAQFASGVLVVLCSSSSAYIIQETQWKYRDQDQNEHCRLLGLFFSSRLFVLHQPYSQWPNPAHDAAEDFITLLLLQLLLSSFFQPHIHIHHLFYSQCAFVTLSRVSIQLYTLLIASANNTYP